MFKTIGFAICAMVLIVSSAFALDENNHNNGGNTAVTNTNVNVNSSHSSASASTRQSQKQDASNQGVNVNTSNEVHAEPAFAPSISGFVSSRTCYGSAGGSAGGGGIFSFGLMLNQEDKECQIERWASWSAANGMPDVALAVAMQSEYFKKGYSAARPSSDKLSSTAPATQMSALPSDDEVAAVVAKRTAER